MCRCDPVVPFFGGEIVDRDGFIFTDVVDFEQMDKDTYKFGYSQSILDMCERRTLENHASFVLPYLKPQLSLLDCGCGLGSITQGFAKKLFPGKVVGIDVNDKLVEYASKKADDAKLSNLSFQTASIFELPFETNTFDIVFTEALLNHLATPLKALEEMKRVLKPGGIIAIREPQPDSIIMYPHNDILKEWWHVRHLPIIEQKGSLRLGMKLKELLLQVKGFTEIDHHMSCQNYGMEDGIDFWVNHFIRELEDMNHMKKVSNAQKAKYKKALTKFSHEPGACFSYIWGEAIAKKA